MRRRNIDADLRDLERAYAATRTIEDASRLAFERRRGGEPVASETLERLLSNASLLVDNQQQDWQRHPDYWQRVPDVIPPGHVLRVWRFSTEPGVFQYVRQSSDVPNFADDPEPRMIRVRHAVGQRITDFDDVTDPGAPAAPVPEPTAGFIRETTRFMLWELLVRPRLDPRPFDLRRDLHAETVENGLMAWSTGEGRVLAGSRNGREFILRTPRQEAPGQQEGDPRRMTLGDVGPRRVDVRPFTLVVHDMERMSVTVGVRFSRALPIDPAMVWPALYEEDLPEVDTAAIYTEWARSQRDDRVMVHEADAIAFAMEPGL